MLCCRAKKTAKSWKCRPNVTWVLVRVIIGRRYLVLLIPAKSLAGKNFSVVAYTVSSGRLNHTIPISVPTLYFMRC